jgi:hypothetical protein
MGLRRVEFKMALPAAVISRRVENMVPALIHVRLKAKILSGTHGASSPPLTVHPLAVSLIGITPTEESTAAKRLLRVMLSGVKMLWLSSVSKGLFVIFSRTYPRSWYAALEYTGVVLARYTGGLLVNQEKNSEVQVSINMEEEHPNYLRARVHTGSNPQTGIWLVFVGENPAKSEVLLKSSPSASVSDN